MVKRGEKNRGSVGEDRSRLLGMAEKGKFTESKKRKRDEDEEGLSQPERVPQAPVVEVEGATGETQSLAMTWHAEMSDGEKVEFDGSSGIDMQYYINNICLHNFSTESTLRACISVKHTPTGAKPTTTPLAVVSPEAPHTVLKDIRFSSDSTPSLILKIVGQSENEDVSKVRVTVCGEQMMNLTEAQIAALLL